MRSVAITLVIAATGLLASCASHQIPENRENVDAGQAYQARYRGPDTGGAEVTRSSYIDALKCTTGSKLSDTDSITAKTGGLSAHPSGTLSEVLSVGDLVEIFIEEDETLSGSYVIGENGQIRVPFLRPVSAAGRTPATVEAAIGRALIAEELYTIEPRVSVILKDYAEATVFVSGAVFEPRQVIVGGSNAQTRDPARQQALGAATSSRRLSTALRNAGGVRPDADLSRVFLIRNGARTRYDIRLATRGGPFPDPILIAGDRVEVPSRQCFQDDLVVPSSVTPPGVKVFLSNLAETARSNSAAATPDAREMRYGTRFLQAVFGLNCVGGSKLTNANRRAVLFSRNPITGESVVIDRSIEDLLRDAERDEFNPYILPEDSIACYDSATVSLRNLFAAFGVASAATFVVD
jgi:protein involved in polysaccharide export with SLBB domain